MADIREIHNRVYAYLTEELVLPRLRFTLRTIDRAERLSQGYWFNGNENFLTLSFWKGNNERYEPSNISFIITKEGTSRLEFIAYNDKKKINFFAEIAESMGMKPKDVEINQKNGNIYHWSKNYKGTNYIEALFNFIKGDKRIIDAFIHSEGMTDVFGEIDEETFNNAKKTVEKNWIAIRNNQAHNQELNNTKSIILKSLSLENISLFNTQQTIEFHKNLTCIVGLNGTGKTSLLRALVLAYNGYGHGAGFFSPNEFEELTDRLGELLYINGEQNEESVYNTTKSGYVEVVYTINTQNGTDNTLYHNRVLITTDDREVIISDDSNSDFSNLSSKGYKTLFIAFPQLLGKNNKKSEKKLEPNSSDASAMLTNTPDDRLGVFQDWIVLQYNKTNDEIAKGNKNPLVKSLLSDVFNIISMVTGEDITLHHIERDENPSVKPTIWVKLSEDSSPIPFGLISQGYNNVFGWIGYFMKRLMDVTPKGEDYRQTHATLIIDEIDTYLHPQWQYKILAVLVEQFPNVQFIVTTHSPYVVGSVPNDKIRIYICQKENHTIEIELFEDSSAIHNNNSGTYGANLKRLNDKIFGKTASRTQSFESVISLIDNLIGASDADAQGIIEDIVELAMLPKFDKFIKLGQNRFENDKFVIAQKAISEMKEITYENDPELLSLESFIQTKKRLIARRLQNEVHS